MSTSGMGTNWTGMPLGKEVQIKNETDGSTSIHIKFPQKINENKRELIINVDVVGDVTLRDKIGSSFLNLQQGKVKKLTRATVPLKYGRTTGELPTTQQVLVGVVAHVLQQKTASAEVIKKNLLIALNDPAAIKQTERELVKAKSRQEKNKKLDVGHLALETKPVKIPGVDANAASIKGQLTYKTLESKAEKLITERLKKIKDSHQPNINVDDFFRLEGHHFGGFLETFLGDALEQCPELSTKERVALCKKVLILVLNKHIKTNINLDYEITRNISSIEMKRLYLARNASTLRLDTSQMSVEEKSSIKSFLEREIASSEYLLADNGPMIGKPNKIDKPFVLKNLALYKENLRILAKSTKGSPNYIEIILPHWDDVIKLTPGKIEDGKTLLEMPFNADLKQKLEEKEKDIFQATEFLIPFPDTINWRSMLFNNLVGDFKDKILQVYLRNALSKPSWSIRAAFELAFQSSECKDVELEKQIKKRYEACISKINLKEMFQSAEPGQEERDLLYISGYRQCQLAKDSPLKEVLFEFKTWLTALHGQRIPKYSRLQEAPIVEYDYNDVIQGLVWGPTCEIYKANSKALADSDKVVKLVIKATIAVEKHQNEIALESHEKLSLEEIDHLKDLQTLYYGFFSIIEIDEPSFVENKKLCEKASNLFDQIRKSSHLVAYPFYRDKSSYVYKKLESEAERLVTEHLKSANGTKIDEFLRGDINNPHGVLDDFLNYAFEHCIGFGTRERIELCKNVLINALQKRTKSNLNFEYEVVNSISAIEMKYLSFARDASTLRLDVSLMSLGEIDLLKNYLEDNVFSFENRLNLRKGREGDPFIQQRLTLDKRSLEILGKSPNEIPNYIEIMFPDWRAIPNFTSKKLDAKTLMETSFNKDLKRKFEEKEQDILKSTEFMNPFPDSLPYASHHSDISANFSEDFKEKVRLAFLTHALVKPTWNLMEAFEIAMQAYRCSDPKLKEQILDRYKDVIDKVNLGEIFNSPEITQNEIDLLLIAADCPGYIAAREVPLKDILENFKGLLAASVERLVKYQKLEEAPLIQFKYLELIKQLVPLNVNYQTLAYKSKTLADFDKAWRLIGKVNTALEKYKKKESLEPSERLSLVDMGGLEDLYVLHDAYFSKLESKHPLFIKKKDLCASAEKLYTEIWNVAQTEASKFIPSGAIALTNHDREVSMRRYPSNRDEKIQNFFTDRFHHASKVFVPKDSSNFVYLSHIVAGYSNHVAYLRELLCMDYYQIDPMKLIKPELLKQIKAKLSGPLEFEFFEKELSRQYQEIERQINEDSQENFTQLHFSKERAMRAGKAKFHFGVSRTTKPEAKKVQKIMEQMTLPGQMAQASSMICSEFTALTTTAALVKLDKWLGEKLASSGIPTSEDASGMTSLMIPIDEDRKYETIYPGEILTLYSKANAITPLPRPAIFNAMIEDT